MKSFNFLFVLLTFAFYLLTFPSKAGATHSTCASIPVSGSYTVPASTTCSFGGAVDGVDGSTLTAGTDTTNNAGITLNTTSVLQIGGPSGATDLTSQVVGWGGTITVPTGGSIVIRNGASMKQGPLWLPDADGDKYPDAATMSGTCTTSSGCFYATRPATSQFRRYYLTGVSGQTTFTYTSDMTADCNSAATGTCPSAPPSGPSATAGGQTQIDLSWTASADTSTTGYKIYRCAGSGCSPVDVSITVTPGTATSYSNITGLSCGILYRYKLFATNSAGTSATGLDFPDVTTSSCVSAPTVTTSAATSVAGSTATLNSSVNPNGAATTGWHRYGTSNVACGSLTTATSAVALGSGSSAVSNPQGISTLTGNTTYYFCAIANNSQGTTNGSVLSFLTLPGTPTGLSATAASSSQINLSWTAPTGGATSYRIYRCQGSGCTNFVTIVSPAACCSLTGDSGLSASTTYRYKVTAVNATGESLDSNIAEATTQAACSSNGSTCSVAGDCCSGNCYVDADGDTYAPATGTKTCKASAQTAGTDCYDSNANAKPGQTSWFTTNRGDASFDYNCDAVSTPKYITKSAGGTHICDYSLYNSGSNCSGMAYWVYVYMDSSLNSSSCGAFQSGNFGYSTSGALTYSTGCGCNECCTYNATGDCTALYNYTLECR